MIVEEMPGLDDAIARLQDAEASEPQPVVEAQVQADGDTKATPPEPNTTEIAEKPDPLKTDTPATTEKKAAEVKQSETPKPGDKPDNRSQFAKDKARRDDSWKALNADKEKLAKDKADFSMQQATLQRQQQQFQIQKQKSQAKFTPEQYLTGANQKNDAATQLELQAKCLMAEATELESNNDFKGAALKEQQANALKEQAAEERAMARQYRRAADVAKNAKPDPSETELKTKLEGEKRHYTMEAAKFWPEVAKAGSEFQKVMATHLQAAAQAGLSPNDYPIMMFYSARLTAAETAAAGVPGKDKELGELRAKVKELEALTAPGGGSGSAQRQPSGNAPLTEEQEEAALRQEALNR